MEIPYHVIITVTKDEFKYAENLKREKSDLYQEMLDRENEISEALYLLRTKNRIEESLPEALPYIDFGVDNVPAVQYDDLRAMISQINKQ